MISNADVMQIITDLFKEEALVIGGLVAIHDIEDDLVWRLVKNLDVIRIKTLHRLEEEPIEGKGGCINYPNLKPHPAIEDFLLKLRSA